MPRNRSFLLALVVLLTPAILPLRAQRHPVNSPPDSLDRALPAFLIAFDNLDLPAFRSCFSDSATVFHPSPSYIKRVDTSDQFEEAWLAVFDRIKRNSGRSSPPYMELKPLDLRIEHVSDDVALVTFHLIDGPTVSRRTLVFKRFPQGWKIVHIHASNLSGPTQN